MSSSRAPFSIGFLLLLAVACGGSQEPAGDAVTASFPCDPDNGGLELPAGLCAVVFADDLGSARHLVVDADGDVYVQRNPTGRRNREGGFELDNPGGVIALRDADGDGVAELRESLNEVAGTGIGIHGGFLYFASNTEIFRVSLGDELVPAGAVETVVTGFPGQAQHAAKTFAFDDAGGIYVNVGGPSNACQEPMRTPEAPGLDPCPQLERQAGIWRFDAERIGQTQDDGDRYATGIRNAVGLAWNRDADILFAMQHGRDSLSQLWPGLFDHETSAELPAEEMLAVHEGADFGWPYCYYDPIQGAKVLAPEYGGDGTMVGRCEAAAGPALAFPAHWAPNALLFYDGQALGERYAGGAFIAFHGSWNRMPFPQGGYNVVFAPFEDGAPVGDFEVLISGFPQTDEVRQPGDAVYRPTGLAQGPDGSLYVSDDRQGRIWRIRQAADGTDPR